MVTWLCTGSVRLNKMCGVFCVRDHLVSVYLKRVTGQQMIWHGFARMLRKSLHVFGSRLVSWTRRDVWRQMTMIGPSVRRVDTTVLVVCARVLCQEQLF